MTTTTDTAVTTQVYRVYIKASPERIWQAITDPAWTARYGYGGTVDYDLRPGGRYVAYTSEAMRATGAPDVAIDGEVVETDPPNRLVQTWRMVMDPQMQAEGFTFEIVVVDDGSTDGTAELMRGLVSSEVVSVRFRRNAVERWRHAV